jgi:hypothetical protein
MIPEAEKCFWGVEHGQCVRLTTLLPKKCGSLNISQPYRPPWPVTGIAFYFLFTDTGWRREMAKFEIIRKKKTKETYKTLFDPENVFYKSGNFIRHHFLKITSVTCCPFRCTHSVSRF